MGSSPNEWLRRLRGAPRLGRKRDFELFEEEGPARGCVATRLRALARELRRDARGRGQKP